MHRRKSHTYWIILSLLCAICVAVIAVMITNKQIAGFDSSIISAVQGLESPALTALFKIFTFIGSTATVAVLSLLLLVFMYFVMRYRSEVFLFIAVMGGTVVFNQIFKYMFHRERPSIHRLVEETGFSFPSGHSMLAFALFGVVAFLLWHELSSRIARGIVIVVAALVILCVGISRIYLGVHYPSDVLGGYLSSGFVLTIMIWFYQRHKEKTSMRRNRRYRPIG